jgi:hypothetical protein
MAQGPSGVANWTPALSEHMLDAFERIQIEGPSIETRHVISARRSMNYRLSSTFANRGVNLWKVGDPDIMIPLIPGVQEYLLPADTVDLLDSYLRTYTPAGGTGANVGNVLTALVGQNGKPLVAQPYGDPLVIQPGNVFSTVAGSSVATMYWPAHGQVAGNPLFWGCPIGLGGVSVTNGFSIVSNVIDSSHLQFMLPTPALETQTNGGGTPLFTTTAGSDLVTVVLTGHGLAVGAPFPVGIPVNVGGLTLSGIYTIQSVQNSYEFTIQASGIAGVTKCAFENGGQANVVAQMPGTQYTDVFLWPLSRNDFAMLPNKLEPGRPTQYWFNRVLPPRLITWPVCPMPTTTNGTIVLPPTSPGSMTGPWFAFIAFRLKRIQNANPIGGQILDMPERFYNVFVSYLAADLAEKYKPAQHATKLALAEAAWEEAASEDREKVSSYWAGDMSGYFN